MDQLDISIHATAHDYGLPEMARKLGIREQVFRNKVNPTEESHKLGFLEWVGMLDVSGDLRSLEVLCEQFGGCFERNDVRENPRDLLRALLAADAEHGDVVQSIRDAMSDGRISPRELAGITKEINQARAALEDLMGFLLHQAGERD